MDFIRHASKIAVVIGEENTDFVLKDTKSKKIVFTGKLGEIRKSQYSGKAGRIADFSAFQKPGNYILEVPKAGTSYPFEIKTEIHKNVAIAAIRGYYYQRASVALPEKFAGKWARAEGHPDDKILIHPSAVSAGQTGRGDN